MHRMGEIITAEQARIAERRFKVEKLMISGVRSATEIARRLEVNVATIRNDKKALEERWDKTGSELGQVRDRERLLELKRVEEAIARVMSHFGLDGSTRLDREGEERPRMEFFRPDEIIKAESTLIRYQERKAKLLGLDMPSKVAHTNPTGDEEYTGGIPKHIKAAMFGKAVQEAQEIEDNTVDAEVIEEVDHGVDQGTQSGESVSEHAE